MYTVKDIIKLLICLTKLTRQHNLRSAYYLFVSYYILQKLETLLQRRLKLRCVSNEIFTYLVTKTLKCDKSYVDDNLYILCNSKFVEKSNNWFLLCCKSSRKYYKVSVVFCNNIEEENIYVSESMKRNVKEKLNSKNLDDSAEEYFLVPTSNKSIAYAAEMKIALISNPYDFTNDLMNNLLQNYFSTPKYLRLRDIFQVEINNYLPEAKYSTTDVTLDALYFKVNCIKSENEETPENGSFIAYGQTALIQEANINSYISQKCTCDIYFDKEIHIPKIWPPTLNELLYQLQSCIAPFLQKDIYIDVKPIFLVEGPNGSGKNRLIKVAAETLGLHFVKADFAEVQSLTSAQTEAKLRIILHEAEACTPCILMLQNIQIFGINSEGQKDDRVLAAFTTEVKKLYSKRLKYPLIIIATSTDSDIPIDSERTFVEKITIDHLKPEQRSELLSWFIKSKGLQHQAVDLQKVAAMCSDFALADLEALVMHAIKNNFQRSNSQESKILDVSYDDFVHAMEYMQSIFSEQMGAPRVPQVLWEDIGGLADLKREIMRRIEMPLLSIPGLAKSGLLLYGPPGTGKTLLAKAVATECQLHFLSVKGPELLNMYVGQSEKNVRQVFERARAAAPCIIFFDELDSLAPKRGQSGDSAGVMDRVVSQLLAEMDGLESTASLFVIGATNRPDLIDPALLRPGRFDKMLYVGVYAEPDSQLSVLRALTRRFNLEKGTADQQPEDLLRMLLGELPDHLTGADLYSVCSSAWLGAVRRLLNASNQTELKDQLTGQDVIVKLEDLLEAAKDLVPSVTREELLRYKRLNQELSSSSS